MNCRDTHLWFSCPWAEKTHVIESEIASLQLVVPLQLVDILRSTYSSAKGLSILLELSVEIPDIDLFDYKKLSIPQLPPHTETTMNNSNSEPSEGALKEVGSPEQLGSSKVIRSYSSSSTASQTPTGSPLFYASGYSSSTVDFLPLEKVSFLDLLDPMSSIQNTTSTLSKKYKQVKEKSKSRIQKFRDDNSTVVLKKKLHERVDKFDKRLNTLFYASSTEKIFYALSVSSIFVAGYVMGHYPEQFHLLYSGLTVVLMPIRFYTYWKRGFQYFLADLCYFVNFLVLLFIWVFPKSDHLYMVCYAFTHGTLSWAVVTWRNSLVLHSIDKYTSSFIHIMPPSVMFVITHQLSSEFKANRFPGAAKVTNWNFFSGVLWTSLYYLIWQSAYHYFITLKRAAKIKAGRATSFEWLRKSFSKAWIGRFVNSLPDPFPVVAFTLIQYGYQLITMSICPVWFSYKYASVAFMTFIFMVASYNGATYYIDYYGKRMEKEVKRLQKEIEELQNNDVFEDSSSSVNLISSTGASAGSGIQLKAATQ